MKLLGQKLRPLPPSLFNLHGSLLIRIKIYSSCSYPDLYVHLTKFYNIDLSLAIVRPLLEFLLNWQTKWAKCHAAHILLLLRLVEAC